MVKIQEVGCPAGLQKQLFSTTNFVLYKCSMNRYHISVSKLDAARNSDRFKAQLQPFKKIKMNISYNHIQITIT